MKDFTINMGSPVNRVISGKMECSDSGHIIYTHEDYGIRAIKLDTEYESATILSHPDREIIEDCDIRGYKKWDSKHELYVKIPIRCNNKNYTIRTYGCRDASLGGVERDSFTLRIFDTDLKFIYTGGLIEDVKCSGVKNKPFDYSLRYPIHNNTLGFNTPFLFVYMNQPVGEIRRVWR